MTIEFNKIRMPGRPSDIRMMANSRQPACILRLRGGTSGFVQRILARYAVGLTSWPRLHGVLLRPWIAWMPQAGHSLRIVLASRVNLAITRVAADGRPQVEEMRGQGLGRQLAGLRVRHQFTERQLDLTRDEQAIGGMLLVPPRITPRRSEGEVPATTRALAPVMEVFRRLSARGERIEGGVYSRAQSIGRVMEVASRRATLPVVTPVPRVVHRNVGGAASAESQPETAKRADARTFSSTPATASPAFDVERLTNEVVRAIDRRIVAQRERLGRV